MLLAESIKYTGIEVIISLVVSNIIAQVLKTVAFAIKNRRLDFSMLVTTGGMPSSHSSSVVGMSTTVGLIEGFDSVAFAICFCICAVVMYDAAGVRRSAGKQAEVLNTIVQEIFSDTHKVSQGKLKELLGHSPKEVIAGAALGIVVALALHVL